MKNSSVLPPLDAEGFRRTLAGLADDRQLSKHSNEAFRERANQLVYVLAICFNRDELDAVTLWERIASAITTACAKVDDGDLDRLVSLALEHVKALPTRVAANDEATGIISTITESDESWRLGFVTYLKQHLYTAIIHGRRYWEMAKEERREARNAQPA